MDKQAAGGEIRPAFFTEMQMAASIVGEFVVSLVSEVLVQIVFYYTGKAVVPVISLGRWLTANLTDEAAPGGAGSRLSWVDSAGRRVVSLDGQALAGFLFYIALLLFVVLYYHL